MSDVREVLHDVNPYEGFNAEDYAEDLQGWGSDDPLFRELITSIRPSLIVEVGTWKGSSAIHMANILRDLELEAKIICVDTWLGSPEHFLSRGFGWRESLAMKNGYPQLYYTFLSNVVRAGHQDRIIPLPTTSENAAFILKEKGVRPDLVYIDAAHEEDAAYRDFMQFWELMADEGVLFGDDYIIWPGVTAAANRFSSDVNVPIFGKPGKFVMSRNPQAMPKIILSSGES